MRKTILLLFVLIGFALTSHAQTAENTSTMQPAMMSIGVDVGGALSAANKTYSTTTGLSFKLELPYQNPRAFFTITAAYSNYNVKNTPATDTLQNGHYIP